MPSQKDLKGLPVTDGQGGRVVGEVISVEDGVATAKLTDEQVIAKIMDPKLMSLSMGC